MLSDAREAGVGGTRRLLGWLSFAVSLQAAVTIGHFAHGAHVYEDPSRYHIVAPALVALTLSLLLAGVYAWRPSRAWLWALVVVVGVPFVGMFGLYHGGFSHALKLIMYAAGTSPERLAEIFDSPDFAVPNDGVFEVTGLLTLFASLVIVHLFVRLVRASKRSRSSSSLAPDTTATGGA
jgi:hypothetical protein